jgi:2,3-bisphosphoglycerate-dependent phosphoglycerate mutase
MSRLVLLRHAKSLWNPEGVRLKDVDLSRGLIAPARRKVLRCLDTPSRGLYLPLKRAIRTLWIVLDETDLMWIPAVTCWCSTSAAMAH